MNSARIRTCALLFASLVAFMALSDASCSLPTFVNFNPASYSKMAQQHGSKSTVCVYWSVNAGIARIAVAAPTNGWVGLAILRNSSWDSTDAVIGGVDDATGTPYANDYIRHFNAHTSPVDTFGDSPILDTAYGGTNLAPGSWNAEQKDGWTVLEWSRVMNQTDRFTDASLTANTGSFTYQRIAWSFDSLDVAQTNNVPEHIAYGLINIDFQAGGATVPDSPETIWFTNVTPTSFTVNWNLPNMNQAVSLGTMKYWQIIINHAGNANCPTASIDYENPNCMYFCAACVAQGTATSLTINSTMMQQRCDVGTSNNCNPATPPAYATISPNTRYYIAMTGQSTRNTRSSASQFFSVRTPGTTTTTATYPGLVTNIRVLSRTSTDLTIGWDAPVDDGNSPITDYEISCDGGNGLHGPYSFYINQTTGDGTVTQSTFANLVDGVNILSGTFRFRIRAKNSVGWGHFTSDNFGDKPAWNIFTVYPLPAAPVAQQAPQGGGGPAPVGAGAAPKASGNAPTTGGGSNPPTGGGGSNPPTGSFDCPDGCVHGNCIAQDTCQCSNGWSGSACDVATASSPILVNAPSKAPTGSSVSAPTASNVGSSASQTTISVLFALASLSLILAI